MDKRKATIGTVVSIIGPVEMPYLVIRPFKEVAPRLLALVNEEVFIDVKKR